MGVPNSDLGEITSYPTCLTRENYHHVLGRRWWSLQKIVKEEANDCIKRKEINFTETELNILELKLQNCFVAKTKIRAHISWYILRESKKQGISTGSFVIPKIKWGSERHAGIFIVSRQEPKYFFFHGQKLSKYFQCLFRRTLQELRSNSAPCHSLLGSHYECWDCCSLLSEM